MTTSRIGSTRGPRALLIALALAGGLVGATAAEAAPALGPSPAAELATPVQYWGGHGDWGHRRHHHRHDDGYGPGRGHGWGHRQRGEHRGYGWGHHHGHHHHRGHRRYEY
ncbi:hypothetical protein [Methylobacterium flocculans]|uniref:hypothetical protein n=1 Tax=Methylobacterium flocculans TaxID=2984843 RepID=UPI0021F286B6|nr:hypothetical protein [Methylobacterium sp. FF17]